MSAQITQEDETLDKAKRLLAADAEGWWRKWPAASQPSQQTWHPAYGLRTRRCEP
nr:hypothetical protein OHB51_17530 [Micromonospora sp. NBC_00855]